VAGELAQEVGRWQEACEHDRERCRSLADCHALQYRQAQQQLVDVLLRLPLEEMRQLIDGLVEACEQVRTLRIL
jgi:hypothetical protein